MDEIINEILNECLKPVKNVANEIVDRKRLKNKLINIGNNLCKHEQSEHQLEETYRKEGQKNCADLKKEINRLRRRWHV